MSWPIRPPRPWTQAVDKGHEFLKDKQAVVTEAVEAGRKAMQREHEWLPGVKKA